MYLKPCQTLDRDIWLISWNLQIRRKNWPLLSRWSWRFSSNRDENTSLCFTSSSISSSFSSESGICYSKKNENKNTVAVNHLCTPGGAQKVCSESWSHLLPQFSPSPDSAHQIYWFPAFPRNWIHLPPSQEFSPAIPKRNTLRFLSHLYPVQSQVALSRARYSKRNVENKNTVE